MIGKMFFEIEKISWIASIIFADYCYPDLSDICGNLRRISKQASY
jgi:hypothetical protein